MDGRALLLWQFLCLLVTAGGWGGWVWILTGRPPPLRRATWLWCGLAGFCAHALALQGLVYLDVPIARTAWPAFGVALAGLAAAGWHGWRGRGAGTRYGWNEARMFAGVFAAVLAVQSLGLLWVGPADFYGKGRYDQANYVVTAQFLVDQRFSTTAADVGLHPWMLRGLEAKEQRITQSVAHGALAVVSGTDCQQAYGAISVFFLGLAGLAVAAWLRTCAVPRWLAAVGGAGAVLGPAVTTLQLDCYFSQASTLFILPALVGLLSVRGPLRVVERVAASLLLAFLVGAYSEIAVVGVGLVIAMRLMADAPWPARLRDLGWIACGSLVANPGYLLRLPRFLFDQWGRARDLNLLAALVPESGTWRGWGRLFLDLQPDAGRDGVVIGAGGVVLGLMACALFCRPWRRSRMLFAALLVPLGVLGCLLLAPVLAKYPFAKLAAGFTPLWLGAATLGAAAAGRRHIRLLTALAALALGAGAVSALPQQAQVTMRVDVLADLVSPGAHYVREELRQHPERTYLVACDHPLIAQWLCYFGRSAQVYFDRRHLGDRIVPSESHAFRRLPAAGAALWWLDLSRHGPVADYAPACTLTVRGAVEEGAVAAGRYYLVRDVLEFEINRPAAGPPLRQLWLDFACTPMAGAAPCELTLSDAARRRQSTVVAGPRMLRFHLALSPGLNRCTLQVRPARSRPDAAGGLVLQSLSLDPITSVGLASDPLPAQVSE